MGIPRSLVIFGLFLGFSRLSDTQGLFTQWSGWSSPDCPVSCGGSYNLLFRTRQCVSGTCSGPERETREITCNTHECGFTPWGSWIDLSCSVSCGAGKTLRTRVRNCTGECTGRKEDYVVIDCFAGTCPGTGVLSPWGQWILTRCPATCGVNIRTMAYRQRNCTDPSQAGGAECTGHRVETRMQLCNNIAGCLSNVTIDGGFSPWTAWANVSCSVTCGQAATRYTYRVRECDNPSPQGGGAECAGPRFQTRKTNCGLGGCSADGGWTQWSKWSTPRCSVTCGREATGKATRTRTCSNPVPMFGGKNCSGEEEDSGMQNCKLKKCSADGGWTQWSKWSTPQCSVTCGREATGKATRTRTCSNPVPMFGGKNCSGEEEDSGMQNCKLKKCSGIIPGISDTVTRIITGVVIGVGLLLVLVIIIFVCLICRKKRRSNRTRYYARNSRQGHPESYLNPISGSLKEGCTSGTASQSRFKRGEWNRAFRDSASELHVDSQGEATDR